MNVDLGAMTQKEIIKGLRRNYYFAASYFALGLTMACAAFLSINHVSPRLSTLECLLFGFGVVILSLSCLPVFNLAFKVMDETKENSDQYLTIQIKPFIGNLRKLLTIMPMRMLIFKSVNLLKLD